MSTDDQMPDARDPDPTAPQARLDPPARSDDKRWPPTEEQERELNARFDALLYRKPRRSTPAKGPLAAVAQAVALGWGVLPLRGKVPTSPSGFKDAATNEVDAALLWGDHYGANIGGVRPVGTFVVDVDVYKDPAKLQPLVDELMKISTPTQKTPRGGWHFVLRGEPPTTKALRDKYGVKDGIDVKPHGRGYVVLAPSLHPQTKTPYEWVKPMVTPVADAPDWLAAPARATSPADADDADWAYLTSTPIEKVASALAVLDPNPRDTWANYGAAIKLAYADAGFQVWFEWGQTAHEDRRASEAECRTQWKSFNKNAADGRTLVQIGTILHAAKDRGWSESDAEHIDGLRLYNPLTEAPKRFTYLLGAPVYLPDLPEQVAFFGRSESFKSVFLQALAVHMAAGVGFDGSEAIPRVVIYAAEEAPLLWDSNLHAWRLHFARVLPPDQAERAVRNLNAGYLKRIDGQIGGLTEKRAGEIAGLLLAQQKALGSKLRPVLVLDPLVEVMDGDESKTEDMRNYIRMGRKISRATEALVMHVHHTGHKEQDRERGSSVFPGAMFARYRVVRPGGAGYRVHLECQKHKARARPTASVWDVNIIDLGLVLDGPDGEPQTGVVVERSADAAPPVMSVEQLVAEQREQRLLKMLRAYRDDATMGRTRLRELLADEGSEKGLGSGTVEKLQDEAVSRGLLQRGGGEGRADLSITDAGRAHLTQHDEGASELDPDDVSDDDMLG